MKIEYTDRLKKLKRNNWFWKMQYCKEGQIPPPKSRAWEEAKNKDNQKSNG